MFNFSRFTSSGKKTPSTTPETTQAETTDENGVKHKTVLVRSRVRSATGEKKLEIMKAFLDVVAEEDLDAFFLRIMDTAEQRQYKLNAPPEILLMRVNGMR